MRLLTASLDAGDYPVPQSNCRIVAAADQDLAVPAQCHSVDRAAVAAQGSQQPAGTPGTRVRMAFQYFPQFQGSVEAAAR